MIKKHKPWPCRILWRRHAPLNFSWSVVTRCWRHCRAAKRSLWRHRRLPATRSTASDEPSERKAVMSPFFVTSRHNWTSRFLWRHRFLLRRTGKHRGIALLVFLHRQPRLGNVVIFVYDGIDVGFDLGDFRNWVRQYFRSVELQFSGSYFRDFPEITSPPRNFSI